jgi:hypothetical protein
MSRKKADDGDDLRPHYDFDRLEIVRYGPGWSTPSAKKGRRAKGSKSSIPSQVRHNSQKKPLARRPKG